MRRARAGMRLPVRLIGDAWPQWVQRVGRRYCWPDPRLVADAAALPAAFSAAMAAFRIGETFKITGSDRHAVADDLLCEHVDLTGATIVDIGASDGATSVDLIRRMPAFKRYVIADISLSVLMVTVGRFALFYDHTAACTLVAGRRLLAWPTLSRYVGWLCLPLIRQAARFPKSVETVVLLNPATRELAAKDPRVTWQTHDVFTPWEGPATVIKVANLLRRLYFDDATLLRGVNAVADSLEEGGHFLLVDNPRAPGVGPRAGVYRRHADGFLRVATTADRPEIDDLVMQVSRYPPQPARGVDAGLCRADVVAVVATRRSRPARHVVGRSSGEPTVCELACRWSHCVLS